MLGLCKLRCGADKASRSQPATTNGAEVNGLLNVCFSWFYLGIIFRHNMVGFGLLDAKTDNEVADNLPFSLPTN